ncbi:metal-dependent hydrolase [Natrinema versiforme]|uniref:Metal-dependent hydrolase n=1 Tax=Natrinema versiforme TaxID=88724 RepID=A0A4P8WK85_9EURY|nr:metal-dependent hydrolase [Natrinema versiforme]QCS43900.1 metal-dependent hydrolase [Natrinema versiforme]
MHKSGHTGGYLLVWTAISFLFLLPQGLFRVSVIGYILGIPLVMVPDEDQSFPLATHRGFSHTFWFALIFGAIFFIIGLKMSPTLAAIGASIPPVYLFFIGFVIIITHIFLDSHTPMGVKPLAPVSEKQYSGDISSNSKLWNWLFYVIGIVGTIVAIYYYFFVGI